MEQILSASTDQQLWMRASGGDTRAFERLYDRYWELLLNEAYKVLKVKEEAEDVVQNLFISLFERMQEVDIQDVKGYLLKANRYAVYNRIRLYVSDKKNLEKLRNSPVSFSQDQLSDWHNYQELEQRMKLVIHKLSDRCKEVFLLSRNHRLSYSEIARQLDISERTVENHIAKALRELRSALEPTYGSYLRLLLICWI